ncbi:large ribosomal subunit protein mL62 isoform X1 [Ammospiza nelsoni]|uniref:Large ribosomal subunit protein mL62 n=1 Tax=Zonotrichia albicollis TaxID=44394 RepID=A0A8D2N7P7_ZONAL|nr:peptidyl-tRNA hydrolase ICT1, mitochondrial [Zonotrichia albicollis]XP_057894868.1 large ribosomal subunit protein mL62 isoform X2 [Melospiza georgiana]XP_058673402.1 large ribosomal subunit protein mL62 isoform X1 [Ammospiza caudacuta]XP_059341834.1 large ribosomal subunit protein mL62 isoform X1 [Ammospiza nelsoni]
MAAHTLRGLCRPRAGLALLCARFSQRPAAGTEYRSSHSLDKLYPPQQDGTAARTTEEPQPPALDIPMARLTVSYSRSSGPGGQNVNKVNSKAEVRFHLASADWIPEAVRQKMALMHRNKINRAGELIVTSEESRYQMRNLAICLEKIRAMVTEAIEKPRVVSKETAQKLIERVEKMNRERLRQKKIHSTIKQSRKADFD